VLTLGKALALGRRILIDAVRAADTLGLGIAEFILVINGHAAGVALVIVTLLQ
jgi:microcompartment protein CcmK/EutM